MSVLRCQITAVSVWFTEVVVIIIKVPWGAGNGNATGDLQCLRSHTHTNTPSGIYLYYHCCIPNCTLLDTTLFHMKNTLMWSHWGFCPMVYTELTAVFFPFDTPSHMSRCQCCRSKLSYSLVKAERRSNLIQIYTALLCAWSLQLSPLPFLKWETLQGNRKSGVFLQDWLSQVPTAVERHKIFFI